MIILQLSLSTSCFGDCFCCEAPHTFWGLGFGYDYETVLVTDLEQLHIHLAVAVTSETCSFYRLFSGIHVILSFYVCLVITDTLHCRIHPQWHSELRVLHISNLFSPIKLRNYTDCALGYEKNTHECLNYFSNFPRLLEKYILREQQIKLHSFVWQNLQDALQILFGMAC